MDRGPGVPQTARPWGRRPEFWTMRIIIKVHLDNKKWANSGNYLNNASEIAPLKKNQETGRNLSSHHIIVSGFIS